MRSSSGERRISGVQIVGKTVVRFPYSTTPVSAKALQHLNQKGWGGAPLLLEAGSGRQELEYIPGFVPMSEPPPDWARTASALRIVARMTHSFHDLLAGSGLTGGAQTVCHNDLAPKNTVYRDGVDGLGPVPIAFIDWDLAAPGSRVSDVAHICWQWLDMGPRVVDLRGVANGIGIVLDEYGSMEPEEVVAEVADWQNRCWSGIKMEAESGAIAMQALVEDGTVEYVRDCEIWTRRNKGRIVGLLEGR